MRGEVNDFNHFILTRFNMPLHADLPPGQFPSRMGLDPGWLARRFDLFEAVCLASVCRQTNPAFRWLVFLDEATPAPYRDRMAKWAARHPFLSPIFCSQISEESELLEIRKREAPGQIRITTRLDNDDAIHPRLIERIRRLAQRQAPIQDLQRGFFISFPIGCCERKGDFYLQRYRFNPFSSFVSAAETNRTVRGVDHRRIADVAPVVFHWCRPMWCQTIHGENVANRLRGVYWPGGGRSVFGPYAQSRPRRFPAWVVRECSRSLWAYALRKEL